MVGGIWWKNTRHLDFLREPTPAQLDQVRLRVEKQLAEHVLQEPLQTPDPPAPLPVIEILPEKPAVDLGDLTVQVTLRDYAERAARGVEPLIELAQALEACGEPLRASLAWERVLDLSKPTAAQQAIALAALTRLRPILPVWNARPESAIPLRLNVTGGKKLIKPLKDQLSSLVKSVELASSGIIKLEAEISSTTPKKSQNTLLITLAAADQKASAPAPLGMTSSPETLEQDFLRAIYILVAQQLASNPSFTRLPTMKVDEPPSAKFPFAITRLGWHEFAVSLNSLPIKKD